jgi:hypothetical protein
MPRLESAGVRILASTEVSRIKWDQEGQQWVVALEEADGCVLGRMNIRSCFRVYRTLAYIGLWTPIKYRHSSL